MTSPRLVSDPRNPKLKRPVEEIAAEMLHEYQNWKMFELLNRPWVPRPVEEEGEEEAATEEEERV